MLKESVLELRAHFHGNILTSFFASLSVTSIKVEAQREGATDIELEAEINNAHMMIHSKVDHILDTYSESMC